MLVFTISETCQYKILLWSGDIKVQELHASAHWSDGHMVICGWWVSSEMHRTITGVFKNQIDWIPLDTGSVHPTQAKICCVA